MAMLNLEEQLVFYRSYHYQTLNVLVHSVFVPTILFTSMGLLMNISLPQNPDLFNLGNLCALLYGTFYLLLDLPGGLLAAPLLYLMSVKNTELFHSVFNYNQWLIGVFVLSWVMQFISHAIFEKRAPALLDNLVQALVLAPFFVLFEGLFLFGIRRNLKEKVDAKALKNIEEFNKRA